MLVGEEGVGIGADISGADMICLTTAVSNETASGLGAETTKVWAVGPAGTEPAAAESAPESTSGTFTSVGVSAVAPEAGSGRASSMRTSNFRLEASLHHFVMQANPGQPKGDGGTALNVYAPGSGAQC